MARCVRLWKGEWKKSVEQEWEFLTDPHDYGYRVLVSETASYEGLDQIVRRRYSLGPHTPVVVSYRLPSCMLLPQGNKTPPMTISDTNQLNMVLSVRTMSDELALLVTMGAWGVAEYQFLCRTNFTVGATSYVFDHTATENSRASYESKFVFTFYIPYLVRVLIFIFVTRRIYNCYRSCFWRSWSPNGEGYECYISGGKNGPFPPSPI